MHTRGAGCVCYHVVRDAVPCRLGSASPRLDRATGTLKKPGNPMAAADAGGAEAELPEELRPAKETKLQVANGRQRQSLILSRRSQRPVLSNALCSGVSASSVSARRGSAPRPARPSVRTPRLRSKRRSGHGKRRRRRRQSKRGTTSCRSCRRALGSCAFDSGRLFALAARASLCEALTAHRRAALPFAFGPFAVHRAVVRLGAGGCVLQSIYRQCCADEAVGT